MSVVQATLLIGGKSNPSSEALNRTKLEWDIYFDNQEFNGRLQSVALKSAAIPNLFDNVSVYNNVFIMDDGIGPVSISIPLGAYNIDTLLAQLKVSIDTLYGPDYFTYMLVNDPPGNISKKVQVTFAGATTVLPSNFNSLIGFNTRLEVDYGAGVPTTLAFYPDMNYLSTLYIYANDLIDINYHTYVGDSNEKIMKYDAILDSVKNDTAFGEVTHFDAYDVKLSEVAFKSPQRRSKLTISIRDALGRTLFLDSNAAKDILVEIKVWMHMN